MFQYIHKSGLSKSIAATLVLILLNSVLFPSVTLALTGGPTQAEGQSFAPASMTNLVDPFTGNFNYNIPLLDVDGYPVNLNYDADVRMEQEASWVGLGWNINPGMIKREVMGVPDDFNGFRGDEIVRELHEKPRETHAVTMAVDAEALGIRVGEKPAVLNVGLSMTVRVDNYTGLGIGFGHYASGGATFFDDNGVAGLGYSVGIDNQGGASYNMSGSAGARFGALDNRKPGTISLAGSLSSNTLSGLQASNVSLKGKAPVVGARFNPKLLSKGAYSSWTPQYGNPKLYHFENFKLSLGGSVYGVYLGGEADIQASRSEVKYPRKVLKPMGYMHLQSEKSVKPNELLMDINTYEPAQTSYKSTKKIPVAKAMPDQFIASAQGLSKTFRVHRNDVGMLHDTETSSGEGDGYLGQGANRHVGELEVGIGAYAQVGTSYRTYSENHTTNGWLNREGHQANPNWGEFSRRSFKHSGHQDTQPLYEPWYFKVSGEVRGHQSPLFDDEYPIRAKFYKKAQPDNGNVIKNAFSQEYNKFAYGIDKLELKDDDDEGSETFTRDFDLNSPPQERNIDGRQDRSTYVQGLTAEEASLYGIDQKIVEYPLLSAASMGKQDKHQLMTNMFSAKKWSRHVLKTGEPVKHHLSEISMLDERGRRFIYGIPVYNKEKYEVSFAVDQTVSDDAQNGWVNYEPEEASNANKNGRSHLFERTRTSAFAHSYLLTNILSQDYADVDDIQGPSEGDAGDYVKFNYSRIDDFEWRIPFAGAILQDGAMSRKYDQTAHYMYGKKDVWYTHSIETKNMVALFVLEDREDSREVNDEFSILNSEGTANIGPQQLKRLKEIRLYNKKELARNPGTTPIKTVHFEYDYSLCKGVPNNHSTNSVVNQGGKLTLKKVYFTFGGSKKGKLSPYEFVYADPDHDGEMDDYANPDYASASVDCWGQYKPDHPITAIDDKVNLSNREFPYVDQGASAQNHHADAWKISQINLPSGASIFVDYERDDYAYVQDKRAMQMVEVYGMGTAANEASSSGEVYEKGPLGGIHTNDFVYFKLPKALPSTLALDKANDAVRALYFHNDKGEVLENVQFNFMLDVARNDQNRVFSGVKEVLEKVGGAYNEEAYEHVRWYANIDADHFGVVPASSGSDYTLGYVKFERVGQDRLINKDVSPIAKAGWHHIRNYLPELVSGSSPMQAKKGKFKKIKSFAEAMRGILKQAEVLIRGGLEKTLAAHEASSKFIPAKSWIRLFTPAGNKKGGDHRVKQIRMVDNWSQMVEGGNDYGTGLAYSYTLANGESSGVASFEPVEGGDENPFVRADFLKEKVVFGADVAVLDDRPLAHPYYPSAVVGYSKVEAHALNNDPSYASAQGATVYEHYTSKDYPVRVIEFDKPLLKERLKPDFLDPNQRLLESLFNKFDYRIFSQGISVIDNDMHGKFKAQTNLDPHGNRVSSNQYFYGDYAPNEVNVPNGEMDEDVFWYVSNAYHTVSAHGPEINLMVFPILGIPVPVVVPVPTKSGRYSDVRLTSMVKKGYISSRISKIVSYDEGVQTTVEFDRWDKEIADYLVTTTTTEYSRSDEEFNPLKYRYKLYVPAYKAYDRMGLACKNAKVEVFEADMTDLDPVYFVKGDELWLEESVEITIPGIAGDTKNTRHLWVDEEDDGTLFAINEFGAPVSGNLTATVIRSGRRNQAATHVVDAEGMVDGPGSHGLDRYTIAGVTNAIVTEYDESRELFCPCEHAYIGTAGNKDVDRTSSERVRSVNKLRYGMEGVWRPKRVRTFDGKRKQSLVDGLDMRSDGQLEAFKSFFGELGTQDKSRWRWRQESTLFSPQGIPIETRDTLGGYTAEQYGFSNTKVVASGANTRLNQMMFDGFEDYSNLRYFESEFGPTDRIIGALGSHLKFNDVQNPGSDTKIPITSSRSHSGRRSLRVKPGAKVSVTRDLTHCFGEIDHTNPE